MTKKSLLKGAAIMAVAGIIVKVLGAFFRIPLANFIGSIGMANYAPAYSLYGFLLVISTTGLPVAISKMVSERYAVGQFREAERVFKISRMLMFILGVMGFLVLFFFGDVIAELINVPGSALSMKATSLALLLVPIMSSYRGYFQGMQEMRPTAISEVAEQLFRVCFGLILAYVLMGSQYEMLGYSAEQRGAAGGCFGASAGAMGGLSVMLIVYMISRKKIKHRIKRDRTSEHEPAGVILKKIAVIAIPITIGSCIMPVVNLIDSGIVMTRLLSSGWEETAAESLFGQLTGFASPIIQFPQVFMLAIVMSLVPMVSAASRVGDREGLHNNISLGLRMTTIISFPSAVGLFILAEPVLTLLYASQKASAAGAAPCLRIYAIGFIFLAIITTMTGALQGIGKQHIPVINLCIGVIVKFIVTWYLTSVPTVNVKGAAIGSAIAYFIAMALDLMAVKKYSGVRFRAGITVIKPMISSLVMGVIVFVLYKLTYNVFGSNTISTMISILAGIIVYGIMILKMKAVEREELMSISAGRKLAVICDKLRLW